MNENIVDHGKTKYVWIQYHSLLGSKQQNLQIVEWPNGEGFTVVKDDDSTIDLTWDEWDAIKLGIEKLSNSDNSKNEENDE